MCRTEQVSDPEVEVTGGFKPSVIGVGNPLQSSAEAAGTESPSLLSSLCGV